jgi:hypothetical protein
VKKGNVLTHTPWRDGRFSSSNHAYWVEQVTKDRPEMTLFLNEKCFLGLLDTGAEVSVIAARCWPCQPSAPNLQGVGAIHGLLKRVQQICWRDEEGHSGLFAPYVLDNLLVNLWERDVWEGMGLDSAVLIVWSLTKCFNKDIIPLQDWENINKASYILYSF